MTSHAIVGAVWGDEGKGKIVDLYSESTDLCYRVGGGPNAGHTVIVGETKHVLHMLPVGILRAGCANALGPAVLVDLDVLKTELAISIQCDSSVLLDERAHIILPFHKLLDECREAASGKTAIGTTKRGVGPVMEDVAARRGPVLGDLRDASRLCKALTDRNFFDERNALLAYYGHPTFSLEETVGYCMSFSSVVVPRLRDTAAIVHRSLKASGKVLFELAQGVMLDIHQGTYPYVTSSLCTPAAIAAILGVYKLDRVTMVSKAYITRVGNGVFPTLIKDERQQFLAKRGQEFGATTGRQRQCGWLDIPMLRYSCRGGTDIALTKLDLFTGLDRIPVCVAYEQRSSGTELMSEATLTDTVLSQVTPVYQELPGWTEDISGCRKFSELPRAAQSYVTFIERRVGLPVSVIGVGRERNDICSR